MGEADDARQLRLDHRHLAFFFLGAVSVCAIFFALGFVVGRGQTYEAAVKEQSLSAKTPEAKSIASQTAVPGEAPAENRKVTALSTEKLEAKRSQDTDYGRKLDFYNNPDHKNADQNFRVNSASVPRQSASETNVNSKSLTPPKSSSKAPQVSGMSLQVGAYSTISDAEKVAKTLRSKGYSVSLLPPGKGSHDKLIRIRVGPFAQLKETNRVKAQLEKDGYQAILKR